MDPLSSYSLVWLDINADGADIVEFLIKIVFCISQILNTSFTERLITQIVPISVRLQNIASNIQKPAILREW